MKNNYPTLKNLVLLFFLLFSFAAFSQTQTFTTLVPGPGTVTVPPGVTQVTIEAWGGGGGGSASARNTYSGGGGGGGAYTIAVVNGLKSGQTINFTVGSGGIGGTLTLNGGNGGDSFFTIPSSSFTVPPPLIRYR
jgi:hypothetical protein